MISGIVAFVEVALVLGGVTASSTSSFSTGTPATSLVVSTTAPLTSSSASASTESVLTSSAPSVPLATMMLDKAQVIGLVNGSVTSFHGIPFAEPPVGNLRFRLPVPVEGYNGTIDATQPATQCIQLSSPPRADMPAEMLQDMDAYLTSLSVAYSGVTPPQGEDCLNVHVQIPTGTKPSDKLPVIGFIYGGGFIVGSNEQISGDAVVARAVQMGQPVIYVEMNYRLNAFGFLGGKEIKDAGIGNLGLRDQREALRWIQKNIGAFGGDPTKATIWGPSAGAISVALHMLAHDGNNEGLFRGAVMSAGSPLPVGDIEEVQPFYDYVVAAVGCASSDDTLQCLRQVPATNITTAAEVLPGQLGYEGLASLWGPRADGDFLAAPPQHIVLAGRVADVPFITGDALDEGTVFATGSFNVTTEREFRDYIHEFYFPRTPPAVLEPLFSLYPSDPAAGSPFMTGDMNQLAPMYKRMAAFQGDVIFQAPRRFFLDQRSSKQPTWSFIGQTRGTPGLGFAHGSDSLEASLGGRLADYIIQFVVTQDPNGDNANGTASERTIYWPKYDSEERQVLEIFDDELKIGNDTLRLGPIANITALTLAYPL